MKMKRFLALLLAVMMVLALAACGESKPESAAPAEGASGEPSFQGSYLMGTGSATGNYYNFGNAVCTVINQVTGANITVNATGGSTENARLLGSGENEFAMIQSDVFSYAHQGIELFDGTPITNFKAVTACYPEMVQIVVRKDSGIDDIDEQFADQATAKNGVQDGTLDGMFLCSGYPNSNVTELSLSGKIEVITIDQEHLDILTKQYPFYSPFTTQTDEYNLGHEITSVAVKCMLVCADTFSEDEIYALTKAIYENLDAIKEINSKANYMSLEAAIT